MDKMYGDYRVVKQIGVGSLGAVFLAEHRFIKKPYVLKVLPEELATDPSFIARFEEEVHQLAELDHPNIVKMHSVSFAEGAYFLVTDYIGEAIHLADYMSEKKGRLPEQELFSVLSQVASALDYAPIVHGTLKLNNILISESKSGIQVHLSDWGLSKVIGTGALVARSMQAAVDAIGGSTLSSLSSSFLQNYAFLAPEQKRFEAVTSGVDTYAFGVLSYYLISGSFPEGVFDMPSQLAPEYRFDWDRLIAMTLKVKPERRAQALLPLLHEISKNSQEPIFRKIDVEEVRETSSLEMLNAEIVGQTQVIKQMVLVEVGGGSETKEPLVKEYHPEKKELASIVPILTEMKAINGGYFQRGSNDGSRDEIPRHKIYIEPFSIDIHPVTNEQFLRFLEFMGGEKDDNHDLIRLKDARINRSAGKLSIETGYTKHPVVGVTWYGAVAYAKWVGKRLPLESEWEIAAQGGIAGLYPTGETIEKTQANFFSSDTTAVMSYSPNALGLYDMAGNVYEWCQDWYGYNYYEASAIDPKNPKGPVQGVYRVLRGGCWKSLKEDLRTSHRHRNNPGAMNGTYGFRCAKDL